MNSGKLLFVLVLGIFLMGSAFGSDHLITPLLTDIEILYLFDQHSEIDWPLLYFLAVENGCRISMIEAVEKSPLDIEIIRDSVNNLTLTRVSSTGRVAAQSDSILGMLRLPHLPDMVILASAGDNSRCHNIAEGLMSLKFEGGSVHGIRRFYARADSGSVNLNRAYYLGMYPKEISRMASRMLGDEAEINRDKPYSTYRLIRDNLRVKSGEKFILAGIERLKLGSLIQNEVENLYRRREMERVKENYMSYLEKADQQIGGNRTESLVSAFNLVKKLRSLAVEGKSSREITPLSNYLDQTIADVARTVLYSAGVQMQGDIAIVNTVEGKKIRFESRIDNFGENSITVGPTRLRLVSGYSTELDPGVTTISPYNSYIRSHLVSLDDSLFHNDEIDSVLVSVELTFENNSAEYSYGKPVHPSVRHESVSEGVQAEFIPDFLIVKTIPELRGDHVVGSAALNLRISKTWNEIDTVQIDYNTPQGSIAVGAVHKSVVLPAGARAVTLKVPLSIFPDIGFKSKVVGVSLKKNGDVIATASAEISVVSFDFNKRIKIALLPDEKGLLEDFLVMGEANYRTLSDRFLGSGDIDFFDLIILGSGCSRFFPSLEFFGDRLKRFVEYGGTVLILGQKEAWPEGSLPTVLETRSAITGWSDLEKTEKEHAVFNEPQKILEISALLETGNEKQSCYPQFNVKSKILMSLKDGSSLLTIERIGKGKIIYCGLPLAAMIREAHPEAIKLFTNLVNFSSR